MTESDRGVNRGLTVRFVPLNESLEPLINQAALLATKSWRPVATTPGQSVQQPSLAPPTVSLLYTHTEKFCTARVTDMEKGTSCSRPEEADKLCHVPTCVFSVIGIDIYSYS